MILLDCLTELNSFYVGVLCLLVTVLLTWQIYKMIDFDRQVVNKSKEIAKEYFGPLFYLYYDINRCKDVISELKYYKDLIGYTEAQKPLFWKIITFKLVLDKSILKIKEDLPIDAKLEIEKINDFIKSIKSEQNYIDMENEIIKRIEAKND